MSRKVITILFILATCLYVPGMVMIIWGYAILLQQASIQAAGGTAGNALGAFTALVLGGFALVGLGGIAQLVTRIGALMEMAKAQEWTWFVLTVIFDWFVVLVYLIAVRPKPNPESQYPANSPYPYAVPGQPWPGYSPQAAGMMPPGAQLWTAYPLPQAPGVMPSTMQPWPSNPTQPARMVPPSEQPLPYPLPTQQQKAPDQPQE